MSTPEKKRTAWVTVRVTQAEKKKFIEQAKAEDMSIGDFVRMRLNTPRVRKTKSERAKVLQLARIGNNLNQLARWANTYKSGTDSLRLLMRLQDIKEQLSCL